MDLDIRLEGNIEDYCFACLKIQQPVEDISNNELVLDSFKRVFNIEVELISGSKKNLCNICLNKLNGASEFHTQLSYSILYLEEYIKSQKTLVEVKHEDEKSQLEVDDYDNDERSNDNEEVKNEDSDSESDNEPLSRLIEKNVPFNAKLKKVPTKIIIEAIEEYQNKCRENSNCIACDFKGVSIRNLSCHMIHKHKEMKADWCSRCNKLVEDVETHKKNHSNKTYCKFCRKNVTRCHYMEHLKNHAGLRYSCKECQKKFITQKALNEHSAQHIKEKPFQCPNCPKSFKLLKSLEDHISLHGRYTCDMCNKHFEISEMLASHLCNGISIKKCDIDALDDKPNSNDLNKNRCFVELNEDVQEDIKNNINIKIEAKKVEDLTCHFCQKIYKTAYKLQKHIEGHMGLYTATCRYCGKGFTCNSDLANHERVHTKEKPFICNVCGKGFVSGATLRIHLKQHTGKPEECDLCHKRFCRKSELRLHQQKHRGERPFLCTECGKSFAQKSHLTCHLTMHSDDRPYSCTICDKSFKKKELLKHHTKLHGEKKFKCTVCYYECHKSYRLQQHMKMHDGKVDLKKNICQLCSKGFSTVSLLNNHMTNVHNVIV